MKTMPQVVGVKNINCFEIDMTTPNLTKDITIEEAP
jgi:hypothetical protein